MANAWEAIAGKTLKMDINKPRNLLHKSRSFFERAIRKRQQKKTTITFVTWCRIFSLKRKIFLILKKNHLNSFHDLTWTFFFCFLLMRMDFAWIGIVGSLAHISQHNPPIQLSVRQIEIPDGQFLSLNPKASEHFRYEMSIDES